MHTPFLFLLYMTYQLLDLPLHPYIHKLMNILLYYEAFCWRVSDFLPNIRSLLTEFVFFSLIVGFKGMLSI